MGFIAIFILFIFFCRSESIPQKKTAIAQVYIHFGRNIGNVQQRATINMYYQA